MNKKEYQAELYYGWQETEEGIYHAFEAVDPKAVADCDEVAGRLAELLDTTANDDLFDYNSMLIRLPDSLVERIKTDAAKEQNERMKKATSLSVQRLGASAFVKWEEVDDWCHRWAQEYFGGHVAASAEREDESLYVSIKGLKDEDRKAFVALYEQYDKSRDYEPDADFETGDCSATLPDCITKGILNRYAEKMGMEKIGRMVATFAGVYLMENDMSFKL